MQHPSTAFAVTFYASLALRVGQLDDAERELQRALAIFVRAFGRRSAKTAHVLQLLGIAAGHRNDLARARPLFDEAISIQRETTSEYDLGIATAALAATLVNANLASEALPHHERALALFDKSIPNSTEGHTFAVQYARALAEAGRCADARPVLDRAEPVLGKAPHLYVELLAARGVCEADNAVLERAVAYCTARPCDLLTSARVRFELAKRIPDRARARVLATEAHDALTQAGVRTPIVAALAELRDLR